MRRTGGSRPSQRWWFPGTALLVVLFALLGAGAAGADTTVTYTATQTIPVAPASTFAGSTGGDGWAVALTPTSVYNVFHHDSELDVACHLQANAAKCWDSDFKTLTEPNGDGTYGFQSSGHPGLWLDQASGNLYVFATRSDGTGGVVCIDTVNAASTSNPFCGFTALTPSGQAPVGSFSAISAPAVVGSRWFAFNYVDGTGVGGSQGAGAENKLLCFDLTTFKACAGQPFTVDLGSSNNVTVFSNLPSPVVAAIGGQVIVPINVGHDELACFDGTSLGNCTGSWPVSIGSGYIGSNGAPFPLLTPNGDVAGLCLPTSGIPCYSLAGASMGTPPNMTSAIFPSTSWNGPGLVIGPRVYVPRWSNEVDCYDYNAAAGCANFPKLVSGLSLLYTVNPDPQRPECIWVNSDSGLQIQNFDAFTGGACGEGPIRVLASASIVATPLCTPGSYTSLQVTSPARSTYTNGTVAFRDGSNNPIPGVADVPIDSTGTVSLQGLNLNTSSGLPQFLITLNSDQGRPPSIVVQLTWTGAFDPSCATKPGTVVGKPPAGGPSGPPGPPAKADVSVTLTSPTYGRTGSPLTFRATVANSGPNASTGVVLRTPVPANATLVSASSTVGNGCTLGAAAICSIGTLGSGASASVTMVFTTGQVGPLTISPSAQADYDTNPANNSASATATVISATAPAPPPPAPTQPGTFNAVGTGTVKVNGVARSPDQLFVLNPGDVVDVTNGMITLTAADGSFGVFSGTQDGTPSNVPAQFTIAIVGGVTELTLVGGDFSVCTAPRSVSATGDTAVRRLWGSAKGSFRTKGKYAAATVRGTVWLVEDRCNGTFTSVAESNVDVLDLPLNTTSALGPGQSYLAKPPVKKTVFKPPTVKKKGKVAQIRRVGLVWAGQTFKTRAAFEAWLVARGRTWAAFRSAHPALAAALAARSK